MRQFAVIQMNKSAGVLRVYQDIAGVSECGNPRAELVPQLRLVVDRAANDSLYNRQRVLHTVGELIGEQASKFILFL